MIIYFYLVPTLELIELFPLNDHGTVIKNYNEVSSSGKLVLPIFTLMTSHQMFVLGDFKPISHRERQ